MKVLLPPLTTEALWAVWKLSDGDGDGSLDRDEFGVSEGELCARTLKAT